jgi:L-galactose dehydrogenase
MMKYNRLGKTELLVSEIGFGAAPLGDVYDVADSSEGREAVHLAIDHGINFFDVSPYYGLTLAEQRLGQALAGRRKDVILATKCGRYGVDNFDFSAQRITASMDESLRRLQTDYIDLFQVHDVEFGDIHQIITETIPAMRRLQEQGKARYIGITGYPLKTLVAIAEATPVDTILTYCHYNLMIASIDDTLTPIARRDGIGLINASPLNMGILTERGAPEWHPAPTEVRQAGKRVVELCKRRGAPVSNLAIRFCLDHPYLSTTLVGMSSPDQVMTNLKTLDTTIDLGLQRDIAEILGTVANYEWHSGVA